MRIISDLVGDIVEEHSPIRIETETLPIGTDSVQVSWDGIPVGSSYRKIGGRGELSESRLNFSPVRLNRG